MRSRALAMTIAHDVSTRLSAVAALCVASTGRPSTQATTAADAPWSGWAQCVLTGQFANQGQTYNHQQTHTWVLTGATASPTSSAAIKQYAATWQVTGQGSRRRGQSPVACWQKPTAEKAMEPVVASPAHQESSRLPASMGNHLRVLTWVAAYGATLSVQAEEL